MATIDASPSTQRFAAAVRQCAKDRGLELQDVAKRCNMSRTALYQKLSPKYGAVTLDTADRIAAALDTTLPELLTRYANNS